MPVRLEQFNSLDALTEQDRIDLEKLYADYPSDFSLAALTSCFDQATPQTITLYAGRFNDRLLGALLVAPDGTSVRIEHLCVRSVTRGRHVGRDLLRETLKALPDSAKQITFTSCIASEAVERLFISQGFTPCSSDAPFSCEKKR